MDSFDIRDKFLNFFKKNGHTIIPSSSLIPAQDPTLLFTNAGMNQFKDVFLGKEKRSYTRATSIQKCVRVGGKHNDFEEVGFTNRHLTFFEMLGNFSFGDYFKKEAIEYAWEFLTKEVDFTIEKLHITVFKDDDQAYKLWNKTIGLPKEKIHKLGKKENFWQMGDTGPCGPCSEIHYDRGKNFGCKTKNCSPECSCGRFIEIWNLVFMQYDRQEDGTLKPLKQTGIDTGMSIERLCMILQNKDSVFSIDIFEPLIKKIEKLTKINYGTSNEKVKSSFHVLIDHARSTSLLIADGCTPSNEGRGYVLRKIIRRAALFAQKISDNPKLFSSIAHEFSCFFSSIYKELKTNRDLIINLIDSEIERFSTNLIQGQNILEKYINKNLKTGKKNLTGKQVFKLYDTYGFPTELTKIIAKEKSFSLDMAEFEKEMKIQQKQSGKKIKDKIEKLEIPENISTTFIGYEKLEIKTKINFIKKVDTEIWIITQESPFYVESGGQVSDKGWIKIQDNTIPIIKFYKEEKIEKPAIAIKISLKDYPDLKINNDDTVECVVDNFARINTEKNHTVTHMLQATLIQVLGKQIKQAGSYVDEKYLRFDFTHHKGLTPEEIEKIENIVNEKIQQAIQVKTFHTTLKKAQAEGVTAIFGEKYSPEKVRVVQISDFSAELCGGTHVENTGVIGCFKILNEESLSTGIRRITAISGPQAIKIFQQSFTISKKLGEKFKVKPENVIEAIKKQQENLQKTLHEIKQLKKQIFNTQIPIWQKQVEIIGKIPFLFLELEEIDGTQFKQICTQIEQKSPGFYFMISKNPKTPERINFFGYISKKWEAQLNLQKFVKFLKEIFEWKGGGNSSLIQGSGKSTNKMKEKIINWIKLI
ncbi:alanine--tRNA ligase [Candidatus Babeliales bacterium]|nr:alanine--tRNA ligase [Candidatus Babeliales bacterium]